MRLQLKFELKCGTGYSAFTEPLVKILPKDQLMIFLGLWGII